MIKDWQPLKGNKNKKVTIIYLDRKRNLCIGYDDRQWIIKRGSHYNYYRTMYQLLIDGLESETKDIIGSDIKTLLSGLNEATQRLELIAKDIKLNIDKETYVA
jgi:hypothetical protein